MNQGLCGQKLHLKYFTYMSKHRQWYLYSRSTCSSSPCCTPVHNVHPLEHSKKTPHIQIYSKGMCVILKYMILKSAQ